MFKESDCEYMRVKRLGNLFQGVKVHFATVEQDENQREWGWEKARRSKFNSVQQTVTRHYSAMMRLHKYQRKQELETNMQRGVEKESICASKLLFRTVMCIFQSGSRAEEFLNTCSGHF